jgi:Phage portal protein
VVQTAFSPQDAEVLLGQRFSVEEIARIFNLPPHMLGVMEGTNFATIEEQNIQFYQMSLMPFLVAIEQEFANKLLGPIERTRYEIRHDVDTLLRGNTAAQREQEKADLATGVRSVNEVRIGRGFNPLDDPSADKHWIPTNNLQALEDMGKTAPEPAVETDPDTATEEDTTLVKAPEPRSLESADLAVRNVVAEVFGRMIRRECQAIRQAAKRDDFREWIGPFYAKHAGHVAESTGMVCHLAATLIGRSIDPAEIAAGIAAESAERLRGLVVCVPPDEMPGAVDRVCSEWESTRASTIADQILAGGDR